MDFLTNGGIIELIVRTLRYVDSRLIDHGGRTAFLVVHMLKGAGIEDPDKLRGMGMLAFLHDVGAYKTEEVDDLFHYESKNVWRHSIYGYLFVRNFSPLYEIADALLFHHVGIKRLEQLHVPCEQNALLLQLADRVDVCTQLKGSFDEESFRKLYEGNILPEKYISFFCDINRREKLTEKLLDGSYWKELTHWQETVVFPEEEVRKYLQMLAYSIDFRSAFTVTHTINTVSVSVELAKRMGISGEMLEKIYFGTFLHDLGKITTPVEILESNGKLSDEEMHIMKQHVSVTRDILFGLVDAEVGKIAWRHHEKLNGKGYPDGLTGDRLTQAERIAAVGDIVSALSGKRSYKNAFDQEKIIRILTKMRNHGELCPEAVNVLLVKYDEIMECAGRECAGALEVYDGMQDEFAKLYDMLSKTTGCVQQKVGA